MTPDVPATLAFPLDLDLRPRARHPLSLSVVTLDAINRRPLPHNGHHHPSKSIHTTLIIITHNQLPFTRLCLETLLAHVDPQTEIIVVDNASTDTTPAYLRSLAAAFPNLRPIFNAENAGFARANNQALAQSRGRHLILLNNDTIVPPGALDRLIAHLSGEKIALVGPVTNRTCNQAQIETDYRTLSEMHSFASHRAADFAGRHFDIPMLAMFCLAMRRDVYDTIGPLDERFGIGTFEDDDYSLRARSAGYRVVCAQDAFVHHFGQASFGPLVRTGEFAALMKHNRHQFEQKWNCQWQPHGPGVREADAEKVRRLVRRLVPPRSTLLVVSRGDDQIVNLDVQHAWHFPRAADGAWAGHHPSNCAGAIEHLESLRTAGAEYLLFPNHALWWLDHYSDFKAHLEARYTPLDSGDESCALFHLR